MSSEVAEAVHVDGAAIERVVEPQSVAELSEILAEALALRQRCLVVGGGTRLAFGNAGGPFELAISTRRLNRILHYEPDDMTLAVEPGCTVSQISELLSASGQMMSLDAAHAERSTIGGAYATGMSSPGRLGGGSLKDWAIGIETVSPDGTIAKAGGMVVKNVTGYDMMHLHYGALGAFGIVSRLNLKVFPLAGPPRAIAFRFDSPEVAFKSALAILNSQLLPSSLIVANDGGWKCCVRCDAPSNAMQRQVHRIIEVAGGIEKPRDVQVTVDPLDAVRAFVEATDLLSDRVVARLSIRASDQLAAINHLTNLDANSATRVVADLGSGLVYAASTTDSDLIERASTAHARPVFLNLPPDAKRGIDVFGGTETAVEPIIRSLKATFDPHGIINLGRFVLGL